MNRRYQVQKGSAGGYPNRQKSLRQRKRHRRRRFFRRCIRLAAALAVFVLGIRLITVAAMPGNERFGDVAKLLTILRESPDQQQEARF